MKMTAFTDSEYTYLHEFDLDGIKERVEQATEGSWEVRNDNEGTEYFPFYVISKVDDEVGEWFAELHVGCEQDAEFIAHARQDVPALITEVERLRETLEEERESRKRVVLDWKSTCERLGRSGDYLKHELETQQNENTALAIEVNQLRDVVWRLVSYCNLPVDEIQRFLGGDSE